MRTWRLCRKADSREALAGRGGLFTSGRWHSRGRRIVYTSATLSLAALEVLVHADVSLLPDDLVQVEIEIPERLKIRELEAKTLPRRWRDYPAPESLRRIGDAWLGSGATPLMRIPSAVIPEECNVLIDPSHPHAARIQVVSTQRFRFDPRLAPGNR